MGTVIQIGATSSGGTQNALASIDVPRDGALIGIQWAVYTDFDADAEFLVAQISFGSVIANTNDSRQQVSTVKDQATVLTAVGMQTTGINLYSSLPDIPVQGGERIYLHVNATAGVVGDVQAALHFDFNLDAVQVRRR